MEVMDLVDLCKSDKAHPSKRRIWEKVSTQVIHRIWFDNARTARDIWRKFMDPDLKTGGKMPYHYVIEQDGTAAQCVALCTIAPGALKLNPYGLQIAVVGDFRKAEPTNAQYLALLQLTATLYRGEVRSIVGHTETAGASADPTKVCPGKFLDISLLRDRVRQAVVDMAKDTVADQLQARM